ETQVLAGLINNEDRRNSSQVPGLANMPVAGRLFQNKEDTANKTEIVLLITPHVVRNVERAESRLEEFNSGTEAEVGGGSLSPPSPIPAIPPSTPTVTSPVPAPGTPRPPDPATLGAPAPDAGR